MSWHCFSAQLGAADSELDVSPRTPMKITKPRTNNNSSPDLLTVIGYGSHPALAPQPPPKDISNISALPDPDTAFGPSAGDCRTRQDARLSMRQYLYDTSAEDQAVATDWAEGEFAEHNHDGIHSGGNGLGGLVTVMRKRLSRPASQKSLPQLPSASASSTLLSSYPSRFSLITENPANPTLIPTSPATEEGQCILNEATSPKHRTLLPPSLTRRRTMLMPGVATRGQPNDILRKPPPPDTIHTQADRDYYYNRAHPESSPLGVLADLQSEGRQSPNGSRAMTPSDLEYSHLGGFKRGSLRITNGSISPAPSGDSTRGDNFSTCTSMTPLQRAVSPLADRPSDAPVLKYGQAASSSLQGALLTAHRPATADLGHAETRMTDDSASIFDNDTPTASRCTTMVMTQAPPRTPDRASEIAQAYKNELPSRSDSFLGSQVRSLNTAGESPGQWTASNPTFLDEDAITSVPRGSARRLSPPNPEKDTHGTRSSSVQSDKSASERRSMSSKPSAKSDSGYSSHVSLRTLEGKSQPILESAVSSVAPQMEAVKVHMESPARAAPPPPTLHKVKSSEDIELIFNRHRALRQSHRKSMPVIRFSDPVKPRDSLSPATLQRKLQKQRRKSQPLLTPPSDILVVTYREIKGEDVPPIPAEVAASLAERLRNFPAVDHTCLKPEHAMGSQVELRLPLPHLLGSPRLSTQSSSWQASREVTDIAPPPPALHRHSSVTKYATERRNSSRLKDADAGEVIADFGTVIQSLGASPYDVAMHAAGVKLNSRRHSTQAITGWHPHQIGAISNARQVTVGMNEECATAFARGRSRDVAYGDVLGGKRRSMSRPVSFAANNGSSSIRRGGPRPRSWVAGATPPGPSLPTVREMKSKASLGTDLVEEPRSEEVVSHPPSPIRAAPIPPLNFMPARGSAPYSPTTGPEWTSQAAAWSARRQSASIHSSPSSPSSPSPLARISPYSPLSDRSISPLASDPPSLTSLPSMSSSSTLRSNNTSSTSSFTPSKLSREVSANAISSLPSQRATSRHGALGRYFGGLGSNYEPGMGVGGSAGTKGLEADCGSSRKGVQISRNHDVDLSDVPVFIFRQ